MRIVTVDSDEIQPEPRVDEVDWFPNTLAGYTQHLFVNDEDFIKDKRDKLIFRRNKQKEKGKRM